MLSEIVDPEDFNVPTKRFSQRIQDYFNEFRSQCSVTVNKLHIGDMVAHEGNLKHLNLATKYSCLSYLKKQAWKDVSDGLPVECKEYLIAEKKTPHFSQFSITFDNSVRDYKKRVDRYPKDIKCFYYIFIRQFFNIIDTIKDGQKKKEEVRRYFRVLRLCEKFPFYFYSQLLQVCSTPPLDPALTIEMVENVFSEDGLRLFVFRRVGSETSLEILLSHAKELHFNFWGLWLGRGRLSASFNPVLDYMRSDDKNSFARIILKHGFRISNQETICRKQFYDFTCRLGNYEGYMRMMESGNRTRLLLIVETFRAFLDPDEYKDKVLTLLDLVRTVPEPYVTPKEMYNGLVTVVSPVFRGYLQEVCQMYENACIYEQDYTIYQPRLLIDLCRCTIRDRLADNMNLPEGIEELGLPNTIKKYLNLEY